MQRLQHEAIAAQRHDDVGVARAHIVVTFAHRFQRFGGVGRRGEMKSRVGQGVSQPPVSDMGRVKCGVPALRSITKSWPRGLRIIAASIAAWTGASDGDARKISRRSALSSWPRHI